MNNTNTATQEFAKEFFLLLLDTHKFLKEQGMKKQKSQTTTVVLPVDSSEF